MIFLSYTWRDQAIAHELDIQLRLAGFEVWIDHRNLRPDADILGQLAQAIQNCGIFIIVKADSHVGSPWMRTELSIARSYRRTILQFIADPQVFASPIRAVSQAGVAKETRHDRTCRPMNEPEARIIEGSGNVFADLGLAYADELLVCAELTHLVHAELRDRHCTPSEAARLLGIEENEAAQLMAGRFVRFSTEQLLHLLTGSDRDVDIVVRRRPAGQSRARRGSAGMPAHARGEPGARPFRTSGCALPAAWREKVC